MAKINWLTKYSNAINYKNQLFAPSANEQRTEILISHEETLLLEIYAWLL